MNGKSMLSLVLFAAILVFAEQASACVRASVPGADAIIDPAKRINQKLLTRAILSEVNYERCKAGLAPLTPENALVRIAEGHSKWMAKARNVSHKSTIAGRRSLRARIKSTGIRIRTGAENIGMVHRFRIDRIRFRIRSASSCHFETFSGKRIPPHSYASLARTVVGYWMASHGHRANILNRDVQKMGTAAAFDRSAEYCGAYYITQDFTG